MALLAWSVAGHEVCAQSGYSVSVSGNHFTVSRSSGAEADTVRYRTVFLSMHPAHHVASTRDTLIFPQGVTSRTKYLSGSNPSDIYRYQLGTTRRYGVEVTDLGGFHLAIGEGDMTAGSSVSASAYDEQEVVVNSGEITVTDDGYNQGYHSVNVATYFDATAPKDYFNKVNASLRMTLSFRAREVNDGYQYVQVYANTSTSNVDNGNENGDPGTTNHVRYAAGFEHKHGATDDTYKNYTFPVASVGNNTGATNPWGHGEGYNLIKQKFSNSRANDGRLVIPVSLSSLYLRFDASGSSADDWVARNTKVHIQAIDNSNPTLHDTRVSPGSYCRGNRVYVTLYFNEIVTMGGSNRSLSTSWGKLDYVDVAVASNAIAFSGVIADTASGQLTLKALNGSIRDMSGNTYTWSGQMQTGVSVTSSWQYPIRYTLDGGVLPSGYPATYDYDNTVALVAPTRVGYRFAGWTGSNGDTPQTEVTIPVHTHGTLSYTANWEANTYSVRFHANGGDDSMEDQTFTYDVSQPLSANEFSHFGYQFCGWDTVADGGDTVYTDGQTVVNLTDVHGGVIDLYARWSPRIYTISCDPAGGVIFPANPTTYTIETPTFTLNNPTRVGSGYHFVGWTGSALSTLTDTITIPQGSTGHRSYLAAWAPTRYYVRYEKNHPNATGTMNVSYLPYAGANLMSNQYAFSSHTFLGWSTTPKGEVVYADGAEVVALSEEHDDTIVLYAQWRLTGPVPYLDENGEARTCSDYSIVAGGENALGIEGQSTWYVVCGDKTIGEGGLTLAGDVNIILEDASILVGEQDSLYLGGRSLSIYAQSSGRDMGKYKTLQCHYEIGDGSLSFRGGRDSIRLSRSGTSLFGNIGNGGVVNITGGRVFFYSMELVFASAGGVVNFGYIAPTDTIKFLRGRMDYAMDVRIKDGQCLCSDASVFVGNLSHYQLGAAQNSGYVDVYALSSGCRLAPYTSPFLRVEKNQWSAVTFPVMNDPGRYSIDYGYIYGLDDGGPRYDMFEYRESSAEWISIQEGKPSIAYDLVCGVGYIFRRARTVILGLPMNRVAPTGDYNFNAKFLGGRALNYRCPNSNLRGYHLIGNPYQHAIYKGVAFDDGVIKNFLPGYYSLNGDGSWQAHPDSDPIAPMQAVLVRLDPNGDGTLLFHDTEVAPSEGGKGLKCTLSGEGRQDVAYARLTVGASLSKMAHLDAEAPSLSIQGNAIASLGDSCQGFPLTVSAATGEYTIAVEAQEAVPYLHLLDRMTGKDVDLLLQPFYTFRHMGASSLSDRFEVRLSPRANRLDDEGCRFFVCQDGDAIIVTTSQTSLPAMLEVYDAMGRRISCHTVEGTETQVAAPVHSGVYVLRLGGQSQKVVIK